ncbi:acyltransferase domain-containing protein, partial [Actinoplanes sp. DH11]|uniref:acyltransferase domain-containing protein n=1 Tax=Actinoplanes sp. DH11 TaxID=2857011 RepID=UPI001E3BACA3
MYDEVVAAFGFDIDAARLDETRFTQAALFAVEVATFRLLQSWGVRPDLLLGHSIGELAAAHVAGLWSLADAVKVVAARGALMQALPSGGAMVAVQATEDDVIARLVDGVSIAAVNGPQAVVISGDEDAVLAVAAGFDKTRRLRVSHAFHSARMEPMLRDFAAVLDEVVFAAPSLGWVSNVTGEPVGVEVMDPQYWVRQVRQPVRFADGLAAMRAAGVTRFIEVGPSGALATHVDGVCLPTIRKNRDEATSIVQALAVAGPDWVKVFPGARRIELPTYAFQHQRFWPEGVGVGVGDLSRVGLEVLGHPLLDVVVSLADSDGVVLTAGVSVQSSGWLAEHRVFGQVVVPAAVLVEWVLCAGVLVGCEVLVELTVQVPLVLPERGVRQVQVVVGDAVGGRRGVGVYSRPAEDAGAGWVRHAVGELEADADAGAGAVVEDTSLAVWPPVGAEELPVAGWYDALASAGLGYGPVFQGLRGLWRRDGEVFADVNVDVDVEGFGIHPVLLDAV